MPFQFDRPRSKGRRSPHKIIVRLINVSLVVGALTASVAGSVWIEAQLRDKPMDNWRNRLEFLGDSIVLGTLESFSILTALGLFILEGRHEQKKLQHYMAWAVIDLANRRETSLGRIQALQDLNESGISLERHDFPGADLFGVQLQGVDLHEATLPGACLEEADLSGAKLYKANLEKTNLERADLEGASIEFAHLKGSNLQRAKLKGSSLLGADIQGADLRAASLRGADLRHADLTEADLTKANLSKANFQGANLFAVNLADADLTEAQFHNAKNLEPEQVKSAKNWELAKYDADFFHELESTPPDARFAFKEPRII